ncbi:hypothetical protein [Chroococcidiopsis cubana]|nr:hypothetical protein [Chroococcidiopsis cubana]
MHSPKADASVYLQAEVEKTLTLLMLSGFKTAAVKQLKLLRMV